MQRSTANPLGTEFRHSKDYPGYLQPSGSVIFIRMMPAPLPAARNGSYFLPRLPLTKKETR